jgi:hypothetical protein
MGPGVMMDQWPKPKACGGSDTTAGEEEGAGQAPRTKVQKCIMGPLVLPLANVPKAPWPANQKCKKNFASWRIWFIWKSMTDQATKEKKGFPPPIYTFRVVEEIYDNFGRRLTVREIVSGEDDGSFYKFLAWAQIQETGQMFNVGVKADTIEQAWELYEETVQQKFAEWRQNQAKGIIVPKGAQQQVKDAFNPRGPLRGPNGRH